MGNSKSLSTRARREIWLKERNEKIPCIKCNGTGSALVCSPSDWKTYIFRPCIPCKGEGQIVKLY